MRPFLYSALLPGTGQHVLGQGRWTGYSATELWAWLQFLDYRREGRALQRRYRDLAWLVARRVSSGRRIDGDFEYYEAMTRFASSGAYDRDPLTPGVQPETDPASFNGYIWSLAQDLFFPRDSSTPVEEGSDIYKRALRYYMGRAYGPEYAWNWGTSGLHQDEFKQLIRASDENLRRSTTMIGVILANHLLSSVDALVSARLAILESQEPLLQLLPSPTARHPGGWALQVRLPCR